MKPLVEGTEKKLSEKKGARGQRIESPVNLLLQRLILNKSEEFL